MAKQMLIDATHPEETRVVALSEKRLEDFDYETASKKQLKGNIYLAKVTRVEPSLQAAFVDYGGNRHGFLPFSEIHPDYYRIPIADREALLAEEAAISRRADDDADTEAEEKPRRRRSRRKRAAAAAATATQSEAAEAEPTEDEPTGDGPAESRADPNGADPDEAGLSADEPDDETAVEAEAEVEALGANGADKDDDGEDDEDVEARVDTVGGDEAEEDARKRARLLRRYKIQEVIKRRQVLLVQVSKEERGNKGAALTTYLSLAGRYCVLMPNTNKGGGISRKIANAADRRRLKKITSDLEVPEGMAVIVRTAGSQRSKAEIRRDYDYLLRLWDQIRALTLESNAPSLIYEEANLIKRAIRDLYNRDMDEILVEGEDGYKAAKDFMKSLMPSHARKVKLYKDETVPLFQRHQVERQLDTMHSMTVQLKSGGYIVINPTEALVSIDVNSGRATKERHIEETALRTNLEAADEVARQLRLRDLAGLIVIDFIDMEENRHNREVERRLKDAMRNDRARIQLGRISPFGLLEMSRQRLRPSLVESSTITCPHCAGSGRVRSTDSSALQILRTLEEEGVRRSGGRLVVAAPTGIALFILNQKRDRLIEIEQRYGFRIDVEHSETLVPPNFELKRVGDEPAEDSARGGDGAEAGEGGAKDEERKRRRRRRSRRKEEDSAAEETEVAAEGAEEAETEDAEVAAGEDGDEQRKSRRRRGKRGGRRRSRRRKDVEAEGEESLEESQADARDWTAADDESDAAAADEADDEAEPVAVEAAGDAIQDTAGDAAEDGAAAKRPRRRSRRKPKAASDETAAEEVPAEETPAGAAVADDVEPAPATADEEDAADEKKKPRRRRSAAAADKPARKPRRSRKSDAAPEDDPAHVEEPAAETSPCAASGPQDGAAEPEESEAETAPAVDGEAAAETALETPPAADETGDETPAPLQEALPLAAQPGAPQPQPAPSQSQPAAQEEERPKRRGWWNRLI